MIALDEHVLRRADRLRVFLFAKHDHSIAHKCAKGDIVLAAEEGWDVSSPLTCTDPDSDLPEWTAVLSKPLAKSVKA